MSSHGLFLRSHYDLQRRPDRTERALRVFFPRASSDYLAVLQQGGEVMVRQGPADALQATAAQLAAQGFRVSVRPIEIAADAG